MAALDAKRRWAGPGSAPAVGPPNKRRAPSSQEEGLRQESYELDAEDQDVRLVEEDLDLEFGAAGHNWERPAADSLDTDNEALCKPRGVLVSIALFSLSPFLTQKAGFAIQRGSSLQVAGPQF